MKARSWIVLTLGIATAVAAVAMTVAYLIDPYGLWKDSRGRNLSIYFGFRPAKFLMSKRYVPSNFDGFLIGPSSCAHWTGLSIGESQLFNECLGGGNAVEENTLIQQALPKRNFKLAIILLDPAVTGSHDLRDGLDSVNSSQSLVSIHALANEGCFLLKEAHLHCKKVDSPPDGSTAFTGAPNFNLNAPVHDTIDPVAVASLRVMIGSLQQQGARIVYVLPPLYDPYYRAHHDKYDQYFETLQAELPSAPVINFLEDRFETFRADKSNFQDRVHTSTKGAAFVVRTLKESVP